MSEEIEIVGKPKTFPNWHRIKVYTVSVDEPIKSTIWYASKKGQIFYAVLSCKYTTSGYVAQFRVVDLSDDGSSIKDPLLIRYINPCDCTVISETLMRIVDRMERLLFTTK